jgi:hypothetical protein
MKPEAIHDEITGCTYYPIPLENGGYFCTKCGWGWSPAVIDAAHLRRQKEWAKQTFGPGQRHLGILDHISKELKEIEDAPDDLYEWVDVMILALDGALNAGWEPQEVIDAIHEKQTRNEARTWPDWRTVEPGKAIEHIRIDD